MKKLFIGMCILLTEISQASFELTSDFRVMSGQGREGGTPEIARINIDQTDILERKNRITAMLKDEDLKKRMIYILSNIRDFQWELEFKKEDLISDIKSSKYILLGEKGGSCFDTEGEKRFATAKMNELGGDICFDLKRIYHEEHLMDYDELLAIAFHEHLHHFGLEDKDHQIGIDLALNMSEVLPWNLGHGDCRMNLLNFNDSFNYRMYADDYGLSTSPDEVENWYIKDFMKKATTVAKRIYEFSGCEIPKTSQLNMKCQSMFPETRGTITTSDLICKAETDEGFMYFTEDMLGYMNVSFNRWD